VKGFNDRAGRSGGALFGKGIFLKKIIPAIADRLRRVAEYIRHPISRWERFYLSQNPWRFERSSEIHRFEETNRIIREMMEPVETILEIGSAEGDQTEWLSRMAHKVHGVEISSTAVRRARRKFENNSAVSFSVGKLPNIRVDERFDLVTAFEVIYYLTPENIRRAFDVMDNLGKKRILSVYWPHLNVLDASLFSTRNVAQQTIYWEDKPRWLVVWW
jgi:ubiquinone/menaquinone biosynthesis C-methylase UbiE